MPNKEENVQIALTRTLMMPWSTSTNESLPSLRQQLSAFNSRPQLIAVVTTVVVGRGKGELL
jgi:hypothetical protein